MMSVGTALDAAGKSPALNRGRIEFSMMTLREGVGQRAFKAIAHFDPDLAFVGRDDEQHAVVLVLLADLPASPELISVILDRRPLQRFQRDDRPADPSSSLPGRPEIRSVPRGPPRPAARLHRRRARSAPGNVSVCAAHGTDQTDPGNGRLRSRGGPCCDHLKFTCGARFAVSSTVNSSIGLLLL